LKNLTYFYAMMTYIMPWCTKVNALFSKSLMNFSRDIFQMMKWKKMIR